MAFQVEVAKTISWFYAAAFGRTPVPDSTLPDNGDIGGVTFWTNAFLAGEGDLAQYNGDLDAIGDYFTQSPEFQARYPDAMTNEQYVTALYDNMLNRAPDLAGFQFWVNMLNSGESRGAVLVDFANTPENQNEIPNQSAALDSFILFIANDTDQTITPDEAGTWLVANPQYDASVIDLVEDTTAPTVDAGQTDSYSEGSAAGATLFTVAAADNDGGSGIASFAIASGNDLGYFQIDADGDISLTAAGAAVGAASNDSTVDPDTFTLGVTATDRAGNVSAAVDVALTVVDITPPELDTSNRSATTIILTFTEALNPASVPAASSFTVLKNGNTAVTVSTVTVANNGVTLALAAPLADTDTVSVSYLPPATTPLQDLAGNPAGDFSIPSVDKDNTPPTIANQTFSYMENTPTAANPVVATVAVTDSDVATFAIVSGNGNNFYSIDNTGRISLTTAGLAATAASNDFETQPNTFALGVTATDNSGNTSTAATITLNVTDDPSDNLAAPIISSLTTGADPQPGVVLGSNNDDITSGLVSANATETTFSSIDFINLGDNSPVGDTLNIELRGANYSGGATVQNVENLKLTAATAAATFNATGITSVTKVINNASPFALTVQNLSKNALNFEIGNINSGNGAGRYEFAAGQLTGVEVAKVTVTSSVGLATAFENLTLDNMTPVANSLGEIDFDAKDGAGYLNLITDASQTSIKTIKVTGTNAFGLNVLDATGNLETTATTIDASGNSGGVWVTNLGAAAHTVTGGAGNDRFDFGANLGATDTITGNGNASSIGDTLSATGAALAAVTAAVKPTVTGIETLMIGNNLAGVVTTVNAALFGGAVSNVRVADQGGNAVANAAVAALPAVIAADAALAAADAADAAGTTAATVAAWNAAAATLNAAVLAAGGSAAGAAAATAAFGTPGAGNTAQAATAGTAALILVPNDPAQTVTFNGLTAAAAGSSNNFRFDGNVGSTGGTYTFNILNAQDAGTNNSATLDLRGGVTTPTSTVVLNGVENITIDTTNATGLKTLSLTDASLQALTVKGAHSVTLGAALASGVNTVDATGLTGAAALTVTLTAAGATVGALVNTAGGADVIVGSSLNDTINTFGGIDTITGGRGADKMNGGTGNDIFVYTAFAGAVGDSGAATTGTTSTSTATLDVLTVNAGDTINLTAMAATYATLGTLQVAGNITSTLTVATEVQRAVGVYDAAAGTFTVGVTGANAVMLSVDDNAGDTTADMSIVLVGVTDVTGVAAGIITV